MIVALLMLLSRADWVLSSLYHGDQSPGGICLAVVALFGVVLLALVPLALLLPAWLAEAALRVLTVAAAVYVFQPAIRALPLFPVELGAVHKIGLALGTLLLAWLAAAKLSSAHWRRMQAALVVGGLLFVTFPMLAVRAMDPVYVRVPTGTSAQGATVVLLLDELNAEAGEQIAAAITQAGGAPRTHRIRTVGASTITVIPEMFGGPHVPQARVCTPTAVCDRTGTFDFSRLRFDPSDGVHIVGFHHPYCAASGQASCARFAPPSRPPVSSLLCSFGRLLPGRKASDCDWFAADDWKAFRERVRDAAMQSPFWQSGGGTLYAHLPFPHPPGHLPSAGLAADYADNLQLAGQIAAQMWRQGHERFGAGFRLIVISDHPLRPTVWCKHAKYRETGCDVQPTAYEGQVPYIVSSGDDSDKTVPADNAHLFESTSSRGSR
ncbi:hypothetical protein ASD35_24995 [Pelomonas sp. Root1444]|nr:hypothetical protein ASD35_24995 [Pelomonas sp. Root1444]